MVLDLYSGADIARHTAAEVDFLSCVSDNIIVIGVDARLTNG